MQPLTWTILCMTLLGLAGCKGGDIGRGLSHASASAGRSLSSGASRVSSGASHANDSFNAGWKRVEDTAPAVDDALRPGGGDSRPRHDHDHHDNGPHVVAIVHVTDDGRTGEADDGRRAPPPPPPSMELPTPEQWRSWPDTPIPAEVLTAIPGRLSAITTGMTDAAVLTALGVAAWKDAVVQRDELGPGVLRYRRLVLGRGHEVAWRHDPASHTVTGRPFLEGTGWAP
jgi:hypothetical protein